MQSNRAKRRFLYFLKTPKGKFSGGFTLLEMAVVMGIMAVVASLVLANYSNFNERLTIRRAAEEIASSVREIEANGLAVKAFGTGATQSFPGYGVYFKRLNDAGGPADSYIIFADKNENKLYDDILGEKIEERKIQSPVRIYDLCANQKQTPVGPCDLSDVNTFYLRPNPIVSLQNGLYSDLEIIIGTPSGLRRTVVIWLSGQVSTE